jgi:hypothetical protein
MDFLKTFSEFSKEKEIFSFWFGCKPCIVVSSNQEIKQILSNNEDFERGNDYKEIKHNFCKLIEI